MVATVRRGPRHINVAVRAATRHRKILVLIVKDSFGCLECKRAAISQQCRRPGAVEEVVFIMVEEILRSLCCYSFTRRFGHYNEKLHLEKIWQICIIHNGSYFY